MEAGVESSTGAERIAAADESQMHISSSASTIGRRVPLRPVAVSMRPEILPKLPVCHHFFTFAPFIPRL
jgi:hypothetical protein